MADDAGRLVARAIESVLEQVPGAPETTVLESASNKLQPWAETAAPASTRSKRPLEALLVELEGSVRSAPDARASAPGARHPAVVFFDRFSGRPATPGDSRDAPSEPGGNRHRRRRRGSGRGSDAPQTASSGGPTAPGSAASPAPGTGRRRSRRGRGREGGAQDRGPAGAVHHAPGTPGQPASPGADSRPAGSAGGRRRRGRRGRGGGGQRPPAV